MQHAVDTAAHPQKVFARLDVYVAGPHAGCVRDEGIHRGDHGLVDGRRDVGVGRRAVALTVAELAARAEVDGYGLVKAALRAHHAHHALTRAQAHLVDRHHVERVGHGQYQVALELHAKGKDTVTHDEVTRQQADGHSGRRFLMQVGHADIHLLGEFLHQLHLGEHALAHQDGAQPAAVFALLRDARVQLILGDGAGPQQQRADALTAQRRGLLTSQCPFDAGSQIYRVKRFGDHVGGPQAVALLEVETGVRAGEHERQCARELGRFGDLAQNLDGVEGAQLAVEQQDGRRPRLQLAEQCGVVADVVYLVGVVEGIANDGTRAVVRIHDRQPPPGAFDHGSSSRCRVWASVALSATRRRS